MKQKGFVIDIDIIVTLAIIALFSFLVWAAAKDAPPRNADGTECIGGYKFIQYSNGEKQQIIGSNASGIPCEEKN
jgi:hypothetical protein